MNKLGRHELAKLPLLWLIFSCGPTAPNDVPSAWIETVQAEWAIATEELIASGVSAGRIAKIKWHHFMWKERINLFPCGDQPLASGCYSTSGLIQWARDYPTALRHEIKHGILHKLRYSCWRNVDHGPGTCPITIPLD